MRVVDRNGYATLYEYDENGNRSAVRYANGSVVSYKYDEVNRLISEKALDKQGGLVAQYEYTLGAAGERTKVEELDRTVEYTYDALYRLTGEKITAADGTVTEYTYAYDNVSNRILKTENGAETTYTYNVLNQLTAETGVTYQYDDAGNLISVTSGTKSTLYVYNAENKLIRATVQEGNSVSVEEYEYDYAGNRSSKTTTVNGVSETVKYLNDNSVLTNVFAEFDDNGNVLCYYTIGSDLISQERNNVVSIYLYDGHGSVRGLIDSTGTLTDTYNYDAFGNLLDKTGTTVNNYLYCGEQFDSATGLYYLRARYMNPSTGTFITQDTYAGTIFDPASLHKYLYANANPVMNIDPSGYNSIAESNAAMAISGILDNAANSASAFALNFYWSFKASLPVFITTASSIMILIADSPAFMDLMTRIANGDISFYRIQQEINYIIIKAQQFADEVIDFVNKANNTSSSNGGASNIPPNDPNFWEKVNEAISKVSNRCKGLGKCDQFKNAFTRELDKRGISYEVIKVEPNHPNAGIFSDKYQGIIGETGYHYGVRVGDVVYDNLTTEGMNFTEWINDLGGSQYVHWH